MSTRTNGVICWYCTNEPDDPCAACDEVNVLLAQVQRLTRENEAWAETATHRVVF